MNPDAQRELIPRNHTLHLIDALDVMTAKLLDAAEQWHLLDDTGRVPAAPSYAELSVPEDARTVLYGCYFQYSPHESAFVLPASYSTTDRALLIQTAVRLLTAQGIGVNFRHAAPASARPPTRPPTAALGTQPTAGTPSSARR
ncbi:hypothetical protein [Streptomyces sp. NPDC001137]|uniref:hypothetical protein n=1 Tax=Streptomyces sp. NPDC001137 TaxID=3154378 RepID=UPI00331F564C